MNKFLPNLHKALKRANLSDLARLNHLFEKTHLWTWYGPQHLKIMLYLNQAGDGTYTVDDLSSAVAVTHRGEPWPSPATIEHLLLDLEDMKLVRVSWAEKGLRSKQQFVVNCEQMHRDWGLSGDFWRELHEAVQRASYHDLKALQRLYRETKLLDQPDFYLRVLTWAAARGTGEVSNDELAAEFGDIYRAVKFAHDRRNPQHALFWFKTTGLLGCDLRSTGRGIRLDVSPLTRFGFTTNEKGGKHE